jgi:hypothetical protein
MSDEGRVLAMRYELLRKIVVRLESVEDAELVTLSINRSALTTRPYADTKAFFSVDGGTEEIETQIHVTKIEPDDGLSTFSPTVDKVLEGIDDRLWKVEKHYQFSEHFSYLVNVDRNLDPSKVRIKGCIPDVHEVVSYVNAHLNGKTLPVLAGVTMDIKEEKRIWSDDEIFGVEMDTKYFGWHEIFHVRSGCPFADMIIEDGAIASDEDDLEALHFKLAKMADKVNELQTYANFFEKKCDRLSKLELEQLVLVGAPPEEVKEEEEANEVKEEVKEEEEYEQSEAYEEYEQSKYDFLYNNNVRPCFSQFIQDYPMGYSFQKPDGDVRYMKVYIYEEEDDEFYEESPPDAKVDPPPPPPTTEVTSVQLRMPPGIETRVTRELWREDNVLWVNIVPYNEPCRYELDFSSKDKYVLNIWYMDSGKSPLHGMQLVKYEAVREIGGRLLSHYVKLVGVDYVIDTEHESPFTCPDFKVAPSEEVKGEEDDEDDFWDDEESPPVA